MACAALVAGDAGKKDPRFHLLLSSPRAYASCVRACRARITRRRWDGVMHSSLGAKEEDGTRDDARQGPSKEPASLSRRVLSVLVAPSSAGFVSAGF